MGPTCSSELSDGAHRATRAAVPRDGSHNCISSLLLVLVSQTAWHEMVTANTCEPEHCLVAVRTESRSDRDAGIQVVGLSLRVGCDTSYLCILSTPIFCMRFWHHAPHALVNWSRCASIGLTFRVRLGRSSDKAVSFTGPSQYLVTRSIKLAAKPHDEPPVILPATYWHSASRTTFVPDITRSPAKLWLLSPLDLGKSTSFVLGVPRRLVTSVKRYTMIFG